MPINETGVFSTEYSLFTNAVPGNDIQFGMDFKVETTTNGPLMQLIFPATGVGNNIAMSWNIDNHETGNNPESLIYSGADNGIIVDTPREISRVDVGVRRTKFSVFIVDVENAKVKSTGISFGYEINTSDATPETTLIPFQVAHITNEQRRVVIERCGFITFI